MIPPDQMAGGPTPGGPPAAPPPDQGAPAAPAQPKQVSAFMGYLAQFQHEHEGMPPEAENAAKALWDSMKALYSDKAGMSPNVDNYSYDDFVHDVAIVLATKKGATATEPTPKKAAGGPPAG